jgi:hypothetical protein
MGLCVSKEIRRESILARNGALFVVVHALAPVVLLGELQVPKELGVHPLGAHVLLPLGLLDPVRVGLVSRVVRARVLLLRGVNDAEREKRNCCETTSAASETTN